MLVMKLLFAIMVVAVCATIPQQLNAQTGKIEAKVIDNISKQVLTKATVQIIETKQGAYTNANGIATIINVRPGSYMLIAKFIGYQSDTLKDVGITKGHTTAVEFKLKHASSRDAIIVQAEKTAERSKMDNGARIQSMTITSAPGRQRIEDIVRLTPGLVAPENRTNYKSGNEQALQTSVSKFNVSEVNVTTSGADAAKGGFIGGEIGNVQYPMTTRSFNTEEYNPIVENNYHFVRDEPLSTFSIDVDAGSYSILRSYLNGGDIPPTNALRIEEMINYFKYEYPKPTGDHPFSVLTDVAVCPWDTSHQILQIGLKAKEIEEDNLPPSNLVFLVDVSGSMNEPNKLPLVKSSLRMLVQKLRKEDKVAIVVYAGAAGLVLDATPGNEKDKILQAIDRLSAGGSTAGGAGIQLAYEIAKKNFFNDGNNRVILATDGDFNVGVSSEAALIELIEAKRKEGVYLTVLGFGRGNYKDSKMEQLADKGNGNYAYVDNLQEAQKVLVKEFGGTLYTVAKDVKLQLEFNPTKIAAYRLIGYENRLLNKEDFNDDTKDAGELGAGHEVTALYEVIPVGSSDKKISKLIL